MWVSCSTLNTGSIISEMEHLLSSRGIKTGSQRERLTERNVKKNLTFLVLTCVEEKEHIDASTVFNLYG